MVKEWVILEDDEIVDEFTGTQAELEEYFDEHYSGGNFDWREA